MIKRDITLGHYVRIPLNATEQEISDAKKEVLQKLMDAILQCDPFIVRTSNPAIADPLDPESYCMTVGLKLGTEIPWFDYEKHDFIPGETLYNLNGREYKVDDHPKAIHTHEFVKKLQRAIVYPTDQPKAESVIMSISDETIGVTYFYSAEDAEKARKSRPKYEI